MDERVPEMKILKNNKMICKVLSNLSYICYFQIGDIAVYLAIYNGKFTNVYIFPCKICYLLLPITKIKSVKCNFATYSIQSVVAP